MSVQAAARVELAKFDVLLVPTAAYNYTVQEIHVGRWAKVGNDYVHTDNITTRTSMPQSNSWLCATQHSPSAHWVI